MRERLILLLCILIFPLLVLSQPMSIASVDVQTFELWKKKDWKGLIEQGKKALEQGIDFYYLRVRMGIAFYENGNFHQAIPHFEKALSMNNEEAYLNEYLYFSYVSAGRQADAAFLSTKFSPQLKEKTGENQTIRRFEIGYNYSFPDDPNVTEKFSINVDSQISGLQMISKSHHLVNVILQHNLTGWMSMVHGYTYIDKTSFLYSQYNGTVTTRQDYNSKLHQYYLAGSIRLAKGLEFIPGFHYINLRYPMTVQRFQRGQFYTVTETVSNHDYLAFASLYKKFAYLTIGGSLVHGELNQARQSQKDVHLGLFPLGNLNVYALGTFSHQTEVDRDDRKETRMAVNISAGAKIGGFLWIEPHAGLGEMHNFVLHDGATVFNSTETIKKMHGIRLITIFSNRFQASLDYSIRTNESFFVPAIWQSEMINTINFKTHSITGGIKWKF